uniref:GpcrRhopsn4 domain-containing protein n=1 Tax=Heterorhabditis bacteriophora TaxID=37862 RepID=A0A1I7WYP7_HETBA
MIGFAQSSLNGTQVAIRIDCANDVDLRFEVQYVLRSSPCDKEFLDGTRRGDNLKNLLEATHIFTEKIIQPMIPKNVTRMKPMRNKRESNQVINSSWHPAQTIPLDGIYFLIVKVQNFFYLDSYEQYIFRFYIIMCVFYSILALIWLVLCIKYYKDILRIQYWIGAVIVLGMVEKAFFLSEYSTMNTTGRSIEGIIEILKYNLFIFSSFFLIFHCFGGGLYINISNEIFSVFICYFIVLFIYQQDILISAEIDKNIFLAKNILYSIFILYFF